MNSILKSNQTIDEKAKKLLKIENELNSNIPSTLWISDLHGEGDRFISILRGRFGLLHHTICEALPHTFSKEKIAYIRRVVQLEKFIDDQESWMEKQDVILCLVKIIKYKLGSKIFDSNKFPETGYRDTLIKILSNHKAPDVVFENELIASRFIIYLAQTIKKFLLDHIMVLGDIFDRGPQPDKIIRILDSLPYRKIMHLVFGNHDILWMGACAGNMSLIAEAMRISCRYDHMEMLERFDIDLTKLKEFAVKTYPVEKATGKFKAKTDKAKSMEKALSIIQFKLEEITISKHPEYEMDSRIWLERLSEMLVNKNTDGLNDSHFPTVLPDAPTKLTAEEADIIEDLRNQFVTSRKLKRLMKFFFKKGKVYHVHNSVLNIHALVPSTQAGEFETFLGKSGKDSLNHLQKIVQEVGDAYLNEKEQKEENLALMFYLWCGPKSPFFGKDAMKTFERYYLLDKATHKETSLYWKTNLLKDSFKKKLLNEFDVVRVVYGHTPVDYIKGQKIASDDGVAVNIDGGFASAYYHRGHAMIQTPKQVFGVVLPTPSEIKEAGEDLESVPLAIELIETSDHPMKVKDTFRGRKLIKERDKILEELEA